MSFAFFLGGVVMEFIAIGMVIAVIIVTLLKSNKKAKRRPTSNGFKRSSLKVGQESLKEKYPSEPDFGKAKFVLKRKAILTEREIECYSRLVKSLSPNFIVFPQVAFSQILAVQGGTQNQNQWLFRTMSQKVADFLVCKKDLTMVAVIELDDSSHNGKEENDKRRDAIIRGVGLMSLRIPRTPPQELLDRYANILTKMHQLDFV
ncbi:DUF2726 domain-containing protein [Chromobacterium violaceum]|uniref:DUF2726 domain-containing protein n=1 Tax=Chromobacterium violaceum TaxID=536 RepID=UPI001BE6EC9E|nr:DUF2726 domain-containing protein [Chromobacterium violaceum]MBT2867672.1 DUF2726 domain-containing protein [Chromobacterium violaceum]